MKKFIFAVMIACAAIVTQGAQFTWKTAKTGGAVNGPESKTLVASTAYIFESTAAETILSAFAAGNDWTVGSLDSSDITTTGKIATKDAAPFTYGGEGQAATINAIFAFTEKIDGIDYLYISTAASQSADAVGAKAIQFTEGGVSTTIKSPNSYTGAGWYAAVPEPTSGFLLLLGFAGLALKRRRA